MDESALVRQALCMQRAALERVLNPQVQRRQVRERRVDSFSFNLKIWKANTWLWWVYKLLGEYDVGEKVWSVWFRDENFHVCPSRTIAQEGLNRRVVVRWEDDCIKAIWQRADENWLNEVRYAKKGRCTYQISEEFARIASRDVSVRNVHVLATHKLRTYAL
jgi:hypothetical protein